MATIIKIEYEASVFTQAGWRGVTISALADIREDGDGQITEVTAIDGEAPTGYTSRTGAKRQRYNAAWVAQHEVGKRKRLATCTIID